MANNTDEKNQYPVWFNKDAKKIHEQLVSQGLTSQAFPDFVKDAFHDKVDSIRLKAKKEE